MPLAGSAGKHVLQLWSVLADLGQEDVGGAVVADEDDFVVLPDHFISGESGRKVLSIPGLPRIIDYANGQFQVAQTQPALDPEDRVVQPDHFKIVQGAQPPTGLEQLRVVPPPPWPPSWWPTQTAPSPEFQEGVPVRSPWWAEHEGFGGATTPITQTAAPTAAPAPRAAPQPAPRTPPPPRPPPRRT